MLASAGSAVFAAILPFACCWGPALLAGISGGATWFSWVHPLRPFFFGLAFLSLGYSFYKAYRQPKAACPNCAAHAEKPGFLKSKTFVWLVAGFVVAMFVFNYFPNIIL